MLRRRGQIFLQAVANAGAPFGLYKVHHKILPFITAQCGHDCVVTALPHCPDPTAAAVLGERQPVRRIRRDGTYWSPGTTGSAGSLRDTLGSTATVTDNNLGLGMSLCPNLALVLMKRL